MPTGFPPESVFPIGLDSDYTLFLVYNSTESVLAVNNQPWEQEITIVPVDADEPEIWADNGFGNISGELFYYDAVAKDANDKVYKLKRIARNLGGDKTKHNSAGVMVRSFVVAEHHKQLSAAIQNIEKFVGINFDPDPTTLDYRIRCLSDVAPFADDACPEIILLTNVIETSPFAGTLIDYEIIINGTITAFRLDFGDGTSTTTTLIGQHRYPPNAKIDPTVIASNNQCQVIQTSINRTVITEPKVQLTPEPFNPNVGEIPEFPPIIITPFTTVPPELTAPLIDFPCISLSPLGAISIGDINIGPINIPSLISISPLNIPSLINFGPLNIPSLINFGPLNIPSLINFGPAPSFSPISFGPAPSFSPISFGPAPSFAPIVFGPAPSFAPIIFGPISFPTEISFSPISIPSIITFSPISIPSLINFGVAPSFAPIEFGTPPTIGPIQFGPAPSFSPISFGPAPSIGPINFGPTPSISPIQFGTAPSVNVNWGPIPTITGTVTVSCSGGASMTSTAFRKANSPLENYDFNESIDDIQINYSDIGIPSEIRLISPDIPRYIELLHNLPDKIELVAPNIPKSFELKPSADLPKEFVLVGKNIPNFIELIGTNLPRQIELIAPQLPEFIKLLVPDDFPSVIRLDASEVPATIQVTGIPKTIDVNCNIPGEIILKADPGLKIPMVYEGGPLKLELDVSKLVSDLEDENIQCVAIMPCPKR